MNILIQLCLISFPISFGFDLTLLHVNDIHSRYEETNKYSGKCKPKDHGNVNYTSFYLQKYDYISNMSFL